MCRGNAKLAHELAINPSFQLPEVPDPDIAELDADAPLEGTGDGANGALDAQLGHTDNDADHSDGGQKAAMARKVAAHVHRLYWQRMVNSLTPPALASHDDLKTGDEVMLVWPQDGAVYPARV